MQGKSVTRANVFSKKRRPVTFYMIVPQYPNVKDATITVITTPKNTLKTIVSCFRSSASVSLKYFRTTLMNREYATVLLIVTINSIRLKLRFS